MGINTFTPPGSTTTYLIESAQDPLAGEIRSEEDPQNDPVIAPGTNVSANVSELSFEDTFNSIDSTKDGQNLAQLIEISYDPPPASPAAQPVEEEENFYYVPSNLATYKTNLASGNVEKSFESNSIRKPVGAVSFLMKLVDKDFKNSGICINTAGSQEPGFLLTGLKFSPNPSTLSINSAKIINRYNTMTRWVEEHWGDEIDNVMFSGSSYSFMGYNLGSDIIDTGLTVGNRRSTYSYKFIKELARFFKSNGMIFQDNKTFDEISFDERNIGITSRFLIKTDDIDPGFRERHPLTGVPKERLYANLYFDYVSFLGYLESFDIIEDSKNPFRFTYSCVFKSEKTTYYQGRDALSFIYDNGAETFNSTQSNNTGDFNIQETSSPLV